MMFSLVGIQNRLLNDEVQADDVYGFLIMVVIGFLFRWGDSMNIFTSLAIIFILGIIGGYLFEKMHLPKLVFYMCLGMMMGPSLLDVADPLLMEISGYLRQIALIIILTRSGLSLKLEDLKRIGRPAIFMCFVPALFEIIGVSIFAPLLLDISFLEACLLASVLAAVSPAVIVPRMIKLMEEGYGKKRLVPELVLAGASCDDIFVIILFYGFKNILQVESLNLHTFIEIPSSILLGILIGVIVGYLLTYGIKKMKLNTISIVIFSLGLSFLMLALESILKNIFSFSALLAIIVMALVLKLLLNEKAKDVQQAYNSLWQAFEIILFVLVGTVTDFHYAFSKEGLIILAVILIGLVFRSLGVILSILKTDYNQNEKLFIILAYLPKATVQASIGAIALSEGLACGTLVLTAAVVSILLTAPIGAILIDKTYLRLLTKD